MNDSNDKSNRFFRDGYERAREANEPIIRKAVEREFAAESMSASWWGRIIIRRRIEREIKQRLERVAPKGGNY